MANKESVRAKKQIEIAKRRRNVLSLYRAKVTQQEIADNVGVTLRTVAKDLAVMRKEWLAEAVKDYGVRQAEELAKLDEIEAQAWLEWRRSQNRTKTRTTRKPVVDDDGNQTGMEVTETVTEELLPDSGQLDRIQRAGEGRCRILGLYAPEKMDIGFDMATALERINKRYAEYNKQNSTGIDPAFDNGDGK